MDRGVRSVQMERGHCLQESECHTDHESDSPFVGSRQIQVGKTSYSLYMYQFEDIVDACSDFNVWGLAVHDIGTVGVIACGIKMSREIVQSAVVGILPGIVLFSKTSPKDIATDELPPF